MAPETTTAKPLVDAVKQTIGTVIDDVDNGKLSYRASELLRRVCAEVRDLQRPGKLIIEITLKSAPRFGERSVEFSGEVLPKFPRPEPISAMRFVDDDGSLVRRDPNQPNLPGVNAAK